MLVVKPITLKQANLYVAQHHRHNIPTNGHKWSIACYDGETIEVRRVCTDGTYNACSILYGRCARIAKEFGYRRIITYTLVSEIGTSLKASGWKNCGEAGGTSWDCKSRPREVYQTTLFGEFRKYPDEKKIRWEKILKGE